MKTSAIILTETKSVIGAEGLGTTARQARVPNMPACKRVFETTKELLANEGWEIVPVSRIDFRAVKDGFCRTFEARYVEKKNVLLSPTVRQRVYCANLGKISK